MTTDTEVIEREQEQEQKEAEAGFAAGFAKASGQPPAEEKPDGSTDAAVQATEKSAAELEAETKAKAEVEAKAADEAAYAALPKSLREKMDKLEAIPGTIDRLAGHVGGFKRQLDSVLATAKAAAATKGDAPTDKQVQAALANPEAMSRLIEDFPDFKAVGDELTAIRTELGKKSAPAVDVNQITKQVVGSVQPMLQSVRAEARALAYIDFKHDGWEGTINTPDFKSWMNAQAPEVKALADSSQPKDAVKMLDLYVDHRKQVIEAETVRLKKQKRLEGAVTPVGMGGSPTPGAISDEEAFARGFKKAKGR